MLEGLAAWILNTYIGEYVENLNTTQLSIGLLQGAVELENLPLKKTALKNFDIPVQVKSGFIGKITLQIPLRRLRSEPWVISIERLFMVAGPYKYNEYDEEKANKAEQEKKAAMLEALERKWQVQKQEKAEGYGASWFSYGTSVATNILENLQLKVKDVHIRYEDDELIPGCPFAFGVIIKSLSAQSTDGNWLPKFVSNSIADMMYKLVDLKNFSCYLDTDAKMIGHLSIEDLGNVDALHPEMYLVKSTGRYREHEYILAPVSAQTCLKRNTSALPMRSPAMPRIAMDMTLEKIAFCLSENQYRCIIQWLKEFERHDRRQKYRKWRPLTSLKESPRGWWKYAISAHLHRIQERNKRSTKAFLTQRVTDVVRYHKAYKHFLSGDTLDHGLAEHKRKIDVEWKFDELKIVRELAFQHANKEGRLEKKAEPKPAPAAGPSEKAPVESKGVLQRWFPGWGGWYGSKESDTNGNGGQKKNTENDDGSNVKPADENVGEPPPKIAKTELEKELMDVIHDTSENTSFLKKDTVFAQFNFCLSSGSFKLLCPSPRFASLTEKTKLITLLDLECSAINMLFESRPRTRAMKFGISVAGFYLRDKFTGNSSFPCLVSPQNRDRSSVFNMNVYSSASSPQIRGVTVMENNEGVHESVSSPQLHMPSSSEQIQEEKIFEFMYEKNPVNCSANYRVSIVTKPLDIVYNPGTIKRVREFFSTKKMDMSRTSQLRLTAAARRQYEFLKEQTKAELKQTIEQILEGDENLQAKRWEIKLDISAPQIIVPENMADVDPRMVIFDLGHLHISNRSHEELQKKEEKQSEDNDDEFQTPLSTPPSEEAMDTQPSVASPPDFSKISLSESQLFDKLYERYSLDLSELQVMVGKMSDNWKQARGRGSTHLHVIDKLTVNLQFERRLIHTTDPEWPSTTIFGTMPCLTMHVNEAKVLALRKCVETLSTPTSASYGLDLSASSSSHSLVESASYSNFPVQQEASFNPNASFSTEKKMSDKMKEAIEDSRLLLAKFSINCMSLEVQSRGRPIVELQVTKVNASMIKRPYDTKFGLTVHSLLVVDALQTYGRDFELLVASHKHVILDSLSGSIRGSEVASPSSPMSPTSPRSPAETSSLNASQSSTSLKVVQEAISKTFQALVASGSRTLGLNDKEPDASLQSDLEEEDTEALISLDLEVISENSPSNNTREGELQIISLQFNSLDIVANQETMVELLRFVKTVVPDKDKSFSTSSSSFRSRSLSISQNPNISIAPTNKSGCGHREVTAEFHRLNVLLMHLEEFNGLKHAKKVATATMSSAKIQATLGKDLDISGSLGGFHVVDVSPDMICYQQVFSVGSDSSDTKEYQEEGQGLSASYFQPHSAMFKTANESVLNDMDSECDINKALTFHYTKGIQTSHTMQSFSGEMENIIGGSKEESVANLSVHIASMCYVHSPRIIHQVSLCLTEFKDYMATFAESIKTAATEVAKEMISTKMDISVVGNKTTMPDVPPTPVSKSPTHPSYMEADSSACDTNTVEKVLLLNVQLETPVIVVPRNPTSSEAFVAQLGQITVKNNQLSSEEAANDTMAGLHRNRMIVEAKDMNLCSMDTNHDLPQGLSVSQYNKSFVQTLGDTFGVPIVYNTTVKMIMDYIQPESINIIPQEDTDAAGWCFGEESSSDEKVKVEQRENILDITAKIETPLKLEVSKSVYEQFLQTLDNLAYDDSHVAYDNQSGNTGESQSPTKNVPEYEQSDASPQSVSGVHMSNSKTKDTAKFLTKKVHFEVPLFNVEMKGDFGEGEKGLVDLKLYSFMLNYEKNNTYTSNISVRLKSLVMEDLLEKPDSKHRFLMVSHAVKDKNKSCDNPKLFLSSSCPNSMIVTPTPTMPRSLPSSFHEVPPHAMLSPSMDQFPESLRAFHRPGIHTKIDRKGVCPQTPPPSLRTSRRVSLDTSQDVTALVHINVLLVNKLSTQYTTEYDKTNRFVDVDFNSLETNINLQTWVILLDFIGLGAKIHDVGTMEGSQNKQEKTEKNQLPKETEKEFVNSVINLKVKSLTLTLNKPEYELAQLNISEISSHITTREGNLKMSGQLGNMSVLDCSPHGALYRERFVTVGKQAVVFDYFKYGLPDVSLEREEDISLKLRMASVHYVHTNRFMIEVIAFIQHFLQLQDVLGRMRAASAGKKVAEKAARGGRIKLDIEANAPIILIPHSSKSTDILVMNLGNLTVKNCFLFDGDTGTLNCEQPKTNEKYKFPRDTQSDSQTFSKTSDSTDYGIYEDMETLPQQPDVHLMTQSLFDEFSPPKPSQSVDLMTSSIYGSLEHDLRIENEHEVLSCSSSQIYDPTDLSDGSKSMEGSSVDPSSPVRLTLPTLPVTDSKGVGLNLEGSLGSASLSSGLDATSGEYATPMGSSSIWDTPDSPRHICLLDVLAVELADMDLFSAERISRQDYKGSSNDQDLEFKHCVIQKQGSRPLKEKCLLKLHIERNLEGEVSHSAPDWRIKGALSSVHCSVDLNQYKLLRGILEHNLGEKLEEFKRPMMSHMQDPKIETVLSGKVWTGISMSIDLNNVTVELLIAHRAVDCPEASLARLDFVCSTLCFDTFSDQSRDVDLVSHEILAYDTRYRDAPADVCPNVFNKILQPDNRHKGSSSLQMELHYRSTVDSNRFMVILNNMKLVCIFDWLLTVQEFLMTTPDDPFQKSREGVEQLSEVQVQSVDLNASGNRVFSPVNVSQSIITKRGPFVEKVEVPFEFKLNVTDTKFVVVEDRTSWDTNAVILKSTAVLAYRPKAQDKLLSCSLQSLEVFSCSLLAEEETALSIIDPLTISIDLNANPLLDPKPVSPGGIQDATVTKDRNLILEMTFNTMNIRLSYHDMKMFLAILNSLPKQALQAQNRDSHHNVTKYPRDKIKPLQDMGFTLEDCKKALEKTEDVADAAIWLTKHATPILMQDNPALSITGVELNATCICLCLIDDCRDSDVPLAELAFNAIKIHQKFKPVNEGSASFQLMGDFYNRALSGWEPFLEQWKCHTEWKKSSKDNEEKSSIQINAPDVMNINITRALLDQYKKTKVTWTEDYYRDIKASVSQSDEVIARPALSNSSQRRRVPFVPFVLHNQTGCTLWFLTVTTNPSRTVAKCKFPRLLIDGGKGQASDAYIQTSDWQKVPAGDKKSFVFHRREKIRHKKTHDLHINQLVVNVEGWHKLSAVSVDKVGVYFRHAEPDHLSASGLAGLVYSSKHDPAKQQMVRVVFDVQQEGSARKVITVRSALMVTNKLDCAIQLRVTTGNNFEGNSQVLTVPKNESIPIPLPYITSLLYIKPSDWPVRYCDQPIQWQHVGLSGQVKDKIMKCDTTDNSGVYRFCASVRREKYPEQVITDSSVPVLPGHSITLLPPVIIHNVLPIDLHYYLKKSDISGTVKPGKKAALHAADPCDVMELGICLENFGHCRELVIPPDTTYYKVKLRLYDDQKRLLELIVRIVARRGGCVNLFVMSSYWLVNKSGLPLIFKQDGCKTEAAGQFEEHELARSVTPLLFSYSDKESATLCTMRVGKSVHGINALPHWCQKFSLESGTGMRKLYVMPREPNRPDWLVQLQLNTKYNLKLPINKIKQVYNIGIEVRQGKGKYRESNIVTFAPRFEIDNQSSHNLAIAQRHITQGQMVRSLDAHLTALPKCKLPFHWPRLDLDQLLCVQLLDVPKCHWSGGFRIDKIDSFHINMRTDNGTSHLLKVEVVMQGPTFFIVFGDAEEMPPPFRIDNLSEVPISYHQANTDGIRLKTYIKPHTSIPYAWDEPTLSPLITLSVQGGTSATYNMDKLEEGEKLYYQNFIYLTATYTFQRSNSKENKQELVLDCLHSCHIVFKKKEHGKRSQLWRMTTGGMLEHEGSMPPRDPRKQGNTTNRLVLDIADIAPQPGKMVPLTLRKIDERRKSTQKWKFIGNRLCCSGGVLCVQALGGEDFLQDGAVAVLGPALANKQESTPQHMQISSQKLCPGSGLLSVCVLMDGPIRVLQIADIRHTQLVKQQITEEESWEIYGIDDAYTIQSDKCLTREDSNHHKSSLELSMNLKGGLGISLINKTPEEFLYISLKNILMDYTSTMSGVKADISVANVQMDNQLFNTPRPVMLYISTTSKREGPENTPALHMAVHKTHNDKWNADIYKHLFVTMKKMNVQLEERLLWKILQFIDYGTSNSVEENVDSNEYDTRKALAAATSVKSKRYYFGTLKIATSRMSLSMVTASNLSPDLQSIKKAMSIPLIKFEDAKVDLDPFSRYHPFETSTFLTSEIIHHYTEELKSQAAKILGSVDFLGNPLGLFNDVTEGISGLIKDGNVGGLLKNVTHGVSNSAAKVASSLSDGLGTLNMDTKHNEKREQIRSVPGGSHLIAGIKGLGYGLFGGLTSVFTQTYEGAKEEGVEGLITGLGKGMIGTVTKPVAGVLDLASGAANAVKDTSSSTSHAMPDRVRLPRCCHGPGGLLPAFLENQAEYQKMLYQLNGNKQEEIFIALEKVRSGREDGLKALITSKQVYFLIRGKPDPNNIILQVFHRELLQCKTVENNGRFYIELVKYTGKSQDSTSSIHKRPQVRCDRQEIAQRVSQQIEYARNLFEEQRHTLFMIDVSVDEDF